MTDKYILTIDGGKENAFTKEYTREELEAKKDYIAQTYAGRYRVDAIGAADTSSIDDNASYTVKFNDSDFSKTYTGAEFKAKRDYLEQNYAGRYDVETSVGSWDDMSQVFAPSLREQLDTFRMENRDFMNDIENRIDTNIQAARMGGGGTAAAFGRQADSLEVTDEDWTRYNELVKQEEELKRAYYTSDEYLKEQNEKAYMMAQMRDRISKDRLAYAQAHPMRATQHTATRGAEADAEMQMFETAGRIMDDAIKLQNAPSRYTPKGTGFRNMRKGAGDKASDIDLWTAGLSEITDNLGVRGVLSKVQAKLGNLNNLSEEDIEGILTPAEKAVLQAWAINAQTQMARAEDLSRGYQAGQGAVESLAFMAEFALTGGVGKAVSEGAETFAKWLGKKVTGSADEIVGEAAKEVAEKAGEGVLKKYSKNLGLSLAEAAGRTGVMPSTFRNISEKATEINEDEDGNRTLVSMNNAFAKGLADSFIETLSEGGRVSALGSLVGDVAGKIPAYAKLTHWLSNTKAADIYNAFQSSGIINSLRAGGWHGIFEEYLEEWYGNALRTLTHVDKDALKDFATVDNQLVTITSFLPLTIFGGTVSTAQVMKSKKQLSKASDMLKTALMDRAYSEEQANEQIDMLMGATPQQVSDYLTPIINQEEEANEEAGSKMAIVAANFTKALVKWQSYNTKYRYQEQEQRDAVRANLLQATGGKSFWMTDENGNETVQRATNDKGEVVFVMSKPTAEDRRVSGITPDGRIVFFNDGEYQLENEKTMNDFLHGEVMAEKADKEKARMLEEKDAAIREIKAASAPGAQVTLGTVEAPIPGIIRQRLADGVIIETPEGIQHMTYEQLGNYIGINATPMTDVQIDEQQSDTMLAEDAQREAELDIEYDDVAAAEAHEEETIAEVESALKDDKPLPLDSEGEVDEEALWNEDPERWAAWNDERKQDGGSDSFSALLHARNALEEEIAQMEKEYKLTFVGKKRNALAQEIEAKKQRYALLDELVHAYSVKIERQLMEKYAAEEAAAQEQAALSASQAQMTEQQMDEMDAQYEGIYSQTRSLNERARLLQEYLDKIAEPDIPAFVLTSRDYDDKMKAAGCSDYVIMQVRDALYQGCTIEGFMVDGKVFLMVEGIPTIDKGRQKYIHEAQHTITPTTDFVARLLATGISRDTLRKYVRALSGGYFYENKSIGVLADEFISFAIEYAYTNTEFSLDLQRLGIDEEAINFIQTIYNEQQGKYFNLAGRRKGRDAHVSSDRPGSSRENDRDLGQVSSGLLGSQRDGSAENSARGAGDREGGEGAAEPAVDDEINPAFVDAISTDAEGVKFSAKLTDSEIDNLVEAMKANAEVAEDLELTPENWEDQFGTDGMVPTPVGNVKMGENQYLKLLQRKRNQYFGMIRPTLVNPDIVLEELSPSENGERDTVLLFIKTFIKPDGSRYVHFESVTIQKDSMEISISSHEIQEGDLKKKMRNDNVAHLRDSLSASEWRLNGRPSDGSDLVPTPSDNLSDSKDSENLETPSESARFSVITPEMDANYLAAVERGDMETAQRMVFEAAKLAMPNTKVVDKKGNPAVVYHGTKGKFNTFAYSREDIGFHFGTKGTARTRIGRGKDARIMQVFLNLENPLIFDTDLGSWDADYIVKDLLKKEMMSYDDAKAILLTPNGYKRNSVSALVDLRQWMSNNGYDGIVYPNWYESDGKDSYIAFNRNQIKSAEPVTYDNNGNVIPLSERFNPENEDIRFSAVRIDPDANQQAEGNVMFSTRRGSLVGMHNISEEKLRKLIKQGGSANPSTAVIDIERQSFDSYGDISLIMPSSLVDAETGRNAGTFTADAWTPTYPQIEKRFSDDNLQRAYWRDITAIPEEMQHEVRMAFDSWRDNRTASGLAYMYLLERGEAPEMVRVAAKYPQEIKDEMSAILGEGRTGFYELTDEEKLAVLDLYIQENFGGSREDFDRSIAETIQRIEDRLSTGKVPSFVEKRITGDLQWMKEHGYNYDNISNFVRDIVSDIRHAGEVNAAATTNRALDYIKDNNLSAEYEQWKESLNDRYGIKEYLFDGYTPSGNPRWLPNTVENASKLMNKQGLAGATGMASSFNRFVATLAPKKKSLSDIRSSKDLLVKDEKLVDDFRDKWSEVFFDLGIKCQPDAKGYEDYGLERLTEAAQKKNPGAYLKKEYGVELSQEDLQRLADMIKAIKTEFPARYFETKFQRPVYLNEFTAAVMPTTTSADIKQAIAEAGLPIFEYDSTIDGARREATLKATDIEGVRFSVTFNSANEELNNTGLSMDNPVLMQEYGLSAIELSKKGNYVTLSKIVAAEQGQGNGTRFMEDLTKNADANGWILALTPDTTYGGTSVARLKKFYKRFGFKDNKGRNTDFNTKESMVRTPIRFSAVQIDPAVRQEMDTIKAKAMWDGTFMKAPNGAETKLTEDQWLLVRTKNFLDWFGDWISDPENASKVVDENGEPMVMYHGSAWEPLMEPKGKAVFRMNDGLLGKGAYFSNELAEATLYAEIATDLDTTEEGNYELLQDKYVTDYFLNVRNEEDIFREGNDMIAVAKSPSQIKSATETTGEFSESDDIRYSSRFDVNTNPTEAQKKAGNYKMGHLRLDGYNITIENPKGSVRRGTDSKGNEWENTLNNDYGYIRGTEGVDGDHIDVYLSDNPAEGNVFVIDQVNPETREFDEHKVMYGFNSMDEAREAYLANFSEEWNGLGTITEVTKDEFRKWIDSSHRKTKPFSEYKSVKADILDEGDIRYSLVTDPATLERLDSEPTIKVYRAMQLIDGKLYPPMSAKVDGKMREPIELGKWEQAEERPDLADDKGYFKLDKGNKTSLKARYNPYFHTSPTPLNDQFSSAQTRPELVTVEVEVPESELTSGYKAEKAKDSVGQMEWKAGVVQSKLSGTRTVILSRWDKPIRIVPDSEVADKIVEMFDGKDITMPSNVVTPSLRAELESRGIPFVETDNNGKPVEVDSRYSVLSTPTDEIVAEGMKFSIQEFARLAGNIFQDMPESFRKEAIEETFKRGWDMQSAIFQIPARLAKKENWDEADKELAQIIRDKVQDAMDESGVVMSRPLTTKEALWMLYRSTEASGNSILDAAKSSMVAHNLGFDKETLAREDEAKEDVRFSAVRSAKADATARLYNKAATFWWSRIKESLVDMYASVEGLVKAIEETSGKEAQGFENVLMALNQQSSKGLAAMEKYTKKYLEPMLDEISAVMKAAGKTYDDVVRYVILKHGLERNEAFAKRDAKEYWTNFYGKVDSYMKSKSHAQLVVALSETKAKVKELEEAIMMGETGKKQVLIDAQTELQIVELALRGDEKQNEADLDAKLEAIDNGADAKYKEFRKNDYSGITSMFYDQLEVNRNDFDTEEEYQEAIVAARTEKFKTLKQVEDAAAKEVEEFEDAADTDRLWKKINAGTKEILRQQYEASMISKEQYDTLREMFKFYVPLRGFKDNTAEDMYTYYRKPNSTGYTKPILAAEGRKTEAESPFGWIASMASSAIASNVKNEARLALYYFVANRPDNGLATLSKTWYKYSHTDLNSGKRVFVPAYPEGLTPDMTAEEAKKAIDAWHMEMEQARKEGKAYESGQKLSLGDSVVNIEEKNRPEHAVNVKVSGKDYTIFINGNPRAAQAINGDLNVETQGDYSKVFGPLLRWMSSVNTSYNPEFWVTNMQRDLLFTIMAVSTKEDPAYRRRFAANYMKAFKVISMAAKNEEGLLGDSEIEALYKEFVDNGGVTGYTQIKDNETWEQEIANYMKSQDLEDQKMGAALKKMRDGFHALHRFGESLEQVSRFAAFMTSRQMGRSMQESINDAKEITVNFNRKGSGKWISPEEAKTLTDRKGRPINKFQRWIAVGLTSIAPAGRRFIMFFNAAIQGLNATVKLYRKNPAKMIGAWSLGYFSLGVMQALLHDLLDDDDDYLDMPQYERRNSLMLGGNGFYFKWALPQEARMFYALGDLFVEEMLGRNPQKTFDKGSTLGQAITAVTDILPINLFEGWRGILPSVAVPYVELVANEDYKGMPIYNEQKWAGDDEADRTAKWSRAYEGTGTMYVGLSRLLNAMTGGDKHDAGFINLQPEKLEHIVQSSFGGTLRTVDKFVSTILAAVDQYLPGETDEKITMRQAPFLNRLFTINDERFKNAHVNELYGYYAAEAEHVIKLRKNYIKDKEKAKKEALDKSEEAKWVPIYKKYKKPIEKKQEQIRMAKSGPERQRLMKEQDVLKKRMIKEISEIR